MTTPDLLPLARLMLSPLRLDATPASVHAALASAADVDWAVLLRHADAHTMAPLLYAAWRQAGALDPLPAEPRARLAQAYADNQVRNSRIRAELLDVAVSRGELRQAFIDGGLRLRTEIAGPGLEIGIHSQDHTPVIRHA